MNPSDSPALKRCLLGVEQQGSLNLSHGQPTESVNFQWEVKCLWLWQSWFLWCSLSILQILLLFILHSCLCRPIGTWFVDGLGQTWYDMIISFGIRTFNFRPNQMAFAVPIVMATSTSGRGVPQKDIAVFDSRIIFHMMFLYRLSPKSLVSPDFCWMLMLHDIFELQLHPKHAGATRKGCFGS